MTMTKEKPNTTKEIPILDESILWPSQEEQHCDDGKEGHSIRMNVDSYIWVFEGRRGGGKTTAMTYYALRVVALYNTRLISNYPIECYIRRHRPDGKTYLQHVKSESLDFEKLLMQSDEYRNCLIVIDEAADVISHMAAASWKNRLVAAFVRQIRKNNNSVFLATQDFELIDKSMRWQVDVMLTCSDMSRIIGDNSGIDRGEIVQLKWFDVSGQWTGLSNEERIRYGENPCVQTSQLFPRFLFGDDSQKAVFDSWYQIDIMDSLRRVDLRLSAIQIGDKSQDKKYPVSVQVLKNALIVIKDIMSNPDIDQWGIMQKDFYKSLGALTDADKNNLGKVLTQFNVERGGDGSKRIYAFRTFDVDLFSQYIDSSVDKA